jgi:hypothetical protein
LVKYGEKLKINRFLACSYTVEGEDPAGKRLDGVAKEWLFFYYRNPIRPVPVAFLIQVD